MMRWVRAGTRAGGRRRGVRPRVPNTRPMSSIAGRFAVGDGELTRTMPKPGVESAAMSKTGVGGLLWGATVLLLMLVTPAVHADPLRYRYVPLDQVPLPAPYVFFVPAAVVNGRVYGTVGDESFNVTSVAVYSDGAIT